MSHCRISWWNTSQGTPFFIEEPIHRPVFGEDCFRNCACQPNVWRNTPIVKSHRDYHRGNCIHQQTHTGHNGNSNQAPPRCVHSCVIIWCSFLSFHRLLRDKQELGRLSRSQRQRQTNKQTDTLPGRETEHNRKTHRLLSLIRNRADIVRRFLPKQPT